MYTKVCLQEELVVVYTKRHNAIISGEVMRSMLISFLFGEVDYRSKTVILTRGLLLGRAGGAPYSPFFVIYGLLARKQCTHEMSGAGMQQRTAEQAITCQFVDGFDRIGRFLQGIGPNAAVSCRKSARYLGGAPG